FFEKIRDLIGDVRITSVTAYVLMRGAEYMMVRYGRDYELRLVSDFLSEVEVVPYIDRDSEISARIWARLRANGYEVNDADIMISAVTIREQENLLTLNRNFQLIKDVANLMLQF
ncbi:type II toxin-antitoxin system VapC family toxin, partial [Geoglobus sp.]